MSLFHKVLTRGAPQYCAMTHRNGIETVGAVRFDVSRHMAAQVQLAMENKMNNDFMNC